MEKLGTHLIIDMFVEDFSKLENLNFVYDEITKIIENDVTILDKIGRNFGDGYGVTAVWLLAESHISFHSWPEKNYAAIDIFTCGSVDPKIFIDRIKKAFDAKIIKVKIIDRMLPLED